MTRSEVPCARKWDFRGGRGRVSCIWVLPFVYLDFASSKRYDFCGDQDDHNAVLLFLLCSKKEIIKLRFSRRVETTFTVFEDVINKQQQLED